MEVTSRPLTIFRYDGPTGKWISVVLPPEGGGLSIGPSSRKPTPSLTFATFNILADCFPFYIEKAIQSPLRFSTLVKEIESQDADVLGMNEVTSNALSIILASKFVQDNYWTTELPSNVNNTIPTHGCVLLFRPRTVGDKILSCYALEGIGKRKHRVPACIEIGRGSERYTVVSLHTTAYQTTENKKLRANQIADVAKWIRGHSSSPASFVIMGDLNLHYQNEDMVVLENDMIDAWAATHFQVGGDNDEGITFDSKSNTMIPRYIPAERRKMRLDRILFSEGFFMTPTSPCVMWANTAIDAYREIFLSDHYGLKIEVVEGHGAWSQPKEVREKLQGNSTLPNEPRGLSIPRITWGFARHSVWLCGRYLNIW